jgi:L-ascorbate 6-phosphate lactonase
MTSGLESTFKQLRVAQGTVAGVWLGQAGYLLKSPAGVIVAIDPYLSDYAEAQWGLQRIVPPAIDPEQLQPDLYLVSHWHEDHLDAPLLKQWATLNPGLFAGPGSCAVRAPVWGWPADQVRRFGCGECLTVQDVTVTACFARHETPDAPAPDAVSFLFHIAGLTIWAICDTEYDARLRPMASEQIDVAFTPINGVGGNWTDREAAFMLATYIKPKLAIPNHYNMWEPHGFGPGATLDPQAFVEAYTGFGGGATRILSVGEITTFSK